jgi:hypothetical protein
MARLGGYTGLLVGPAMSSTKSSKEYEGVIIRNDVAYSEVLIDCPTKKAQMEEEMKTQMKLIALQDTLILH